MFHCTNCQKTTDGSTIWPMSNVCWKKHAFEIKIEQEGILWLNTPSNYSLFLEENIYIHQVESNYRIVLFTLNDF
jgi:hypothetical protein